jgi:hypothetical protein
LSSGVFIHKRERFCRQPGILLAAAVAKIAFAGLPASTLAKTLAPEAPFALQINLDRER